MLILAIIIFLFLSAFFSGSEIAFISANKLGIEVKRERGFKRGKIISRFYEKPRSFLSTMLVGNNIALVIFTYFMTILLQPLYTGIIVNEVLILVSNTILITLVVLLFGEFLPKTIFRLFPGSALFSFAYLLLFFKWILGPITWFTNYFSNLILKHVLGTPAEKVDTVLTRMDLDHYVQGSIKEGHEEIDKEIFSNVLKLNQLKVRDCMIPRNEIVNVDKIVELAEVLNIMKESRHSRIFVTDGDIDNVVGYIHHAQFLRNPNSIEDLILEVPYVPGAMNARDLMLRFISQGANIACVVDEFGGTDGLITLEDILEEIFGEIEDEYDVEDYVEEELPSGEFIFSGRLELDYITEKYPQFNFPEGEYQTLSGYLVMTLGKIPEEAEVIQLEDYSFIIEKVSDTKLELIRIRKSEKTEFPDQNSSSDNFLERRNYPPV